MSSRLPTGSTEETPQELNALQRSQGHCRARNIYAGPGDRLPSAGLSLFISQAWGVMLSLPRPASRKCHSGFAEAGNTHTEWTRQIDLLAGVIPESGCRYCLKHPHPPEALFFFFFFWYSQTTIPPPPQSSLTGATGLRGAKCHLVLRSVWPGRSREELQRQVVRGRGPRQ